MHGIVPTISLYQYSMVFKWYSNWGTCPQSIKRSPTPFNGRGKGDSSSVIPRGTRDNFQQSQGSCPQTYLFSLPKPLWVRNLGSDVVSGLHPCRGMGAILEYLRGSVMVWDIWGSLWSTCGAPSGLKTVHLQLQQKRKSDFWFCSGWN